MCYQSPLQKLYHWGLRQILARAPENATDLEFKQKLNWKFIFTTFSYGIIRLINKTSWFRSKIKVQWYHWCKLINLLVLSSSNSNVFWIVYYNMTSFLHYLMLFTFRPTTSLSRMVSAYCILHFTSLKMIFVRMLTNKRPISTYFDIEEQKAMKSWTVSSLVYRLIVLTLC